MNKFSFSTFLSKHRHELDRYDTPAPAIDVLLQQYPELQGESLLDPCSGNGLMAERFRQEKRFATIRCNDIDKTTPAETHLHACDKSLYTPRPCWVITNPPFRKASEIAKLAIENTKIGVALLLRCTFLEPCQGRLWLLEKPPTRLLSIPRMSFTKDGKTDSAPAWWFLWIHGEQGSIRVIHHAQKKDSLCSPRLE